MSAIVVSAMQMTLLMLCLLLVGCGGGGGGGSSDGGEPAQPARYTVTASAGIGGSISPATVRVSRGETAELQLTADSGYELAGVTGCGGSLTGATFTTAPVRADCAVSASFTQIPPANSPPSLDLLATSVTVDAGALVNLTATASDPEDGNITSSISWQSVRGNSAGGNFSASAGSSSFTITVSVVDSDGASASETIAVTVNPTAPVFYTVTASAGTGGSISPGSTLVAAGGTAQFTLTPGGSYQIAGASGCGGSLSGSTYTTGVINANCAVIASFSLIPVNSPPTLTPSTTSLTVDAGDPVNLTATASDPEDGNLTGLISWESVNGDATGETFSVTAGASSFAVTVSVTDSDGASASETIAVTVNPPAPVFYTVTASAGAGGSISPGSASVAAGGTTQFTLTPDSGYQIAGASGCAGSRSGSTYTTGAINANCAVTASFSAIPNTPPTLTPSTTSLTVDAGDPVTLSATASDPEDGELTSSISWTSIYGNDSGGSFAATAGSNSFVITASVTDSDGDSDIATITVTVNGGATQAFDFGGPFTGGGCDGSAALQPLVGFTTNNASALPATGTRCGAYMADLTDNSNDITLHFNQDQGRLDAVSVDFPFEAVARGVGIAPLGQPTQAYISNDNLFAFVGVQVHHADLENRNSAHVVAGQRGNARNTIEGKHTRDGSSRQNDIGDLAVPNGRADIRIIGNADRTITVYWQPHDPGASDNWQLYVSSGSGLPPGQLPGPVPDWGNTVYVGLITYAFGNNAVPFTGVVDSFTVTQLP